jgi:hypothetical protein
MSQLRCVIHEKDLQGLKYFKALSGLLERLHKVGCRRDRAGNRKLHMDQYMSLLLLWLFNPLCTSLRALQAASLLPKVQRMLGVPRSSLGSLSESVRIFDSNALLEIIGDLAKNLPDVAHSAKLDDVGAVLRIVDGTLHKGLPRTVQALWVDPDHRAFKSHVHYEPIKGIAIKTITTDANTAETQVLADDLEPGLLYILDRGYASYKLFQQIIDTSSHFVCRIQDNSHLTVLQQRPLDSEATAAGVRRDLIVELGSHKCKRALRQPLRVIEVVCTESTAKRARAKREGMKIGDGMLLVTDRMDLPADVIALIYRCRWEIEIFFRFFKHILGCRHLLSHDKNGIEIQTYAAIIACLLIALYTSRKPTKRTYEMFGWYMLGWADEADLLAHIEKLKNQD